MDDEHQSLLCGIVTVGHVGDQMKPVKSEIRVGEKSKCKSELNRRELLKPIWDIMGVSRLGPSDGHDRRHLLNSFQAEPCINI